MVFPEVDLHWLLTGEMKEIQEKHQESSSTHISASDAAINVDAASEEVAQDSSKIKTDNHKEDPNNSNSNSKMLTVLYSDGTYLEYKPRI
jgi:hypothetical protein